MFEDFDCIAKNLADIGAISLDDYLDPHSTAPLLHTAPSPALAPVTEPAGVNAVTRLHQACQRAFQSTDALKFEFIEQVDSRNKQCILTIIKPDGVRRSYATQPTFAKKNEAKLEAAKIAIDMGALDFLVGGGGESRPVHNLERASLEASSADNAANSDSVSVQSKTAPETCVEDIGKCCIEWRAGRITPQWVPFFDAKLTHKQGCALRIQLSQHIVRVYLSDPAFDTYLDAKEACAKAAVLEGVLNFIRHGNGQTRPLSPTPSTSSTSQSPPLTTTTPWTLRAFYDTLPRPFPEPFDINDASEINAPGWLNTMVQNARGGKLILSFFFTSDGPPGLHGCLLKLDRSGEYKASLVDARFPKRSDAKAAVCLQAMSEGIGDYIRTITSALDAKITPAMRSFSSSLVYPALTSELSKADTDLVPLFEYDKERDAFGATLIVRLSTVPAPGQVRQYTVPSDYRNKADAKVAVICHAAEQGAVEFVRFRGGAPPDHYQSPYVLQTYDPGASRKRKQPECVDDAGQGQPAKKKVRTKRTKRTKRLEKRQAHDDGSCLTLIVQHLAAHPSGDQIHGISGPGDMGLSQSISTDGLGDPSQPGVGSGSGSGAARPAGASYSGQIYGPSYPAVLDPRFAGDGGLGGHGYALHPVPGAYGGASRAVDIPPPESGSSRAMPGSSSRTARRQVDHAELEPGEVVSSMGSEFSESSSRNEEGDVCANEREVDSMENKKQDGMGVESVAIAGRSKDKGKGRETSPANTSAKVSREGPGATTTAMATAPHVKKLIDYCVTHGYGMPSFHETQRQGRFQVWIVIGKEQFDLPTTYGSAEEGRQRVAKQVLARMYKGITM